MRGKIKKDQLLLAGIIIVLVIALGQLGMLIYRTYSTSEENTEYVEFRIEQYENASIKLFQKEAEIKPIQDSIYKIEKGTQIRLVCKADEDYGIQSLFISNKKQEIKNIKIQEVEFQIEEDSECIVDTKKVYKVQLKNKGKGSTTFENTSDETSTLVFEGDQIKVNCIADKYNCIYSITVNGENYFKNKENKKCVDKYDYISPKVDRDYVIEVEFKVKSYTIEIEKNEEIDVTINNVKTDKLTVNGGLDVAITIDCHSDKSNLYLEEIIVNDVGEKLSRLNSEYETIVIPKVNSNQSIIIKVNYIKTINNPPNEIFAITKKDNSECSYRVVQSKSKVIYYLSETDNILVLFKSQAIMVYNGLNVIGDSKILITQNTEWPRCYFKSVKNGECIYAYPVSFIFDSTPPPTPTYTLSHQSLTKATITTTVHDSGDSGIDYVQFGTKSDYEAKLSSDDTKKKYNYEINNTTGATYTISFDQQGLTEEDYYIWAVDNATNRSEPTKIDLQGPEVTITSKTDWTNQDVTIAGSAKDQESKISTICYSTNKEAAESHYSEKKTSEKVNTSVPDGDGSFTIECKSEKSGRVTYYIWAYDAYGNKSNKIKEYEAKIDKKAPVLTLVKKSPAEKWTNTTVTMEFMAIDKEEQGYSGIDQIYYALDQESSEQVNLEVNEKEEQGYVIQTPKGEDGVAIAMQGYYYIYASDKAGNLSEPLKIEVNIDVDPAKPCNLEIITQDGKEVVREQFGTFANQAIYVEVCAQDSYVTEQDKQTVASGTKEIALLCNGKQIAKTKAEEADNKEGKCRFSLSPEFEGELSVVTYDYAGNRSEPIKISTVNSFYNSYICLETEGPDIQITCEKPAYTDQKKAVWFGEHQPLKVTVRDKKAGICNIEATLNGNKLGKQENGKEIVKISDSKKTKEATFIINSGQNGDSEDGHYTLDLIAYDNAGNEKTYTKTIYVDNQEPVITKFAFEANGVQDHKDKLIEKLDYGYFFNGSTKVTVSSTDAVPSSGLKEIEYYLVDYGKDKEGIESKKRTIKTDSNGNASFIIDKKFKGKICARAIDAVHNTTVNYAKPYGVIIDSSTKDNKDSQIELMMPDTSKKDAEGNNLYNKDVDITLDLANYYKGIRSVEWEVSSEGGEKDTKTGRVEASSSGQLSGDRSGYEILETDKNLITHLQGKVHVSGDTNKIRLHVVLTDRSGVQSEKEVYLSIDKSKPQVSISFDKAHESTYYNEERTATICVKDKNFSPNDVKLQLHNVQGDVPKLSGWTKQKDGETYMASLVFTNDGLYSLSATATDLVGNQSDTIAAKTFTLDKTKPVVEVGLNQVKEKSKDVRYYNQAVQARITISEYNFDINKVEIIGSGTYKGKTVAYPKLSYIHSTKQNHVMVIGFTEEGEYTLKVKCTDNAGNVTESEQEYHFVVDQSAPQIEITGVEDSKAYNGTVIPIITITDSNYKADDTKISLSNGMGEKVETHPTMKRVSDGFCFTLDCFPKEKEYDAVYELLIESKDMAGNGTAKKMYFSINRFGSSYQFSDVLKKAAGKYSNKEFDVILTETNVNAIDPSKSLVRMVCNDTVKDLTENQDYIVTSSGGNGNWYTYQYQISKDLLKEDGVYQFVLYTKDEAGNANENSQEEKEALVWFGIDRTAPRVVPINISDGGTYNETKRLVSVNVDDNIRMKEGKVYVNDREVAYTSEGSQYIFEVGSSNQAQTIRIVATDMAGNTTDVKVANLYITTNVFVRLIHSRIVVIAISIALCAVFSSGFIALLLYRRKDKKNIL